jgi:hypothetical protein
MTMRSVRTAAAVLVGVFLATGLVRGANGQFGAIKNRAKKMLESTAGKNDVKLDDDMICVKGILAGADLLSPGSHKAFTMSGRFAASTSFSAVGPGLTLASPTVAKDSLEATLDVAPDALPGAAVVRGRTKGGKTADSIVAFVGGAWRIEGTTDNGWRAKLSPAASAQPSTLAFKAEFFEGKAATPFATREASLHLRPQAATPASYVVEFKPPTFSLDEGECGPVLARAAQLADQLIKAKTKAEENRISAEVDKIQDKIDNCMGQQQADAKKTEAKIAAMTKSAEFTCNGLELKVAADGTAQGSVECGNGSHAFTGTMKAAK